MSESDAPPSYNENVVIPEQQHSSSVNEIAIVQPPTSNIKVAETSLMDFTTSNCLHETRIHVTKYKQSAYIWALLLCCFGGVICCFIPFCMKGLKIKEVYCEQCERKISSIPKKTKNAHIFLTVIFIVCLFGSILLVLFKLGYFRSRSYFNNHY